MIDADMPPWRSGARDAGSAAASENLAQPSGPLLPKDAMDERT